MPRSRRRSLNRWRSLRRSPSKTKRSRSKVRIPISKESKLRRYGYGVHKKSKTRRSALSKASKKYGPLSVFRKLNALVVLNKNVNKSNARVYKSDRNWVKSQLM